MKIKNVVVAFCAISALSFVACKSTNVEAADMPESGGAVVEEEKEEEKAEENTNALASNVDFSEANRVLIEKVEAAKKLAVEEKAPTYYPELFKSTDDSFSDVKSRFAENPSLDYSSELNELLAKFKSMEMASKAQTLKAKASKMAESDLDDAILKVGSVALEKYDALASNGSGADMLTQAEIAYKAYDSLVNKGFTAMVGRERKAALEAKKNAESVKAQVNGKTKDSYKNATEIFKKAESAFTFRNNEVAYNGYKSSKESYIQMYELVKKAREEAQAALERAKQAEAESLTFAEETDVSNPLTEKVAGIEDENAVLLEEDTFANPDDSVIDVESGEVAETASKIAEEAIAVEDAMNNVTAEDVKKVVNAVENAVENASESVIIDEK